MAVYILTIPKDKYFILISLKPIVEAKGTIFSLIVSIPLSSIAFKYNKSQFKFLAINLANVVLPVPATP